jgi:hypothetical protein
MALAQVMTDWGLILDHLAVPAPEMETYGPWDLLWGDQQREWML